MNDEVKEILIDLIEYYNAIGTENDPGFVPFADVVGRASKALQRHAIGLPPRTQQRSADIDPFAVAAAVSPKQLPLKFENER